MMGYETKVIVGETFEVGDEEGRQYIHVVCMLDLSNAGHRTNTGRYLGEQLMPSTRLSPDTRSFYYYAEDGNTRISEDMYGDALVAVDIRGLIEAMEKDQAEDGEFRRFTAAIALLSAIEADGYLGLTATQIRVVPFGH